MRGDGARPRGTGGRRGGRRPGGHRRRGLLRGRRVAPRVRQVGRRRRRLLVSNFFGAGVSELRTKTKGKEKEEERVVLADPDVAVRVALGLTVDAPRGRLLIVYAYRIPRFGYSAVAAYELTSWCRLFLTRLDGPGA